jgi:DNA-binding response OmpR family regulator
LATRVLYLDDEAELCEIFSDELSSPEVSVTTYTDPDAAIAAAQRQPKPDIVFCTIGRIKALLAPVLAYRRANSWPDSGLGSLKLC